MTASLVQLSNKINDVLGCAGGARGICRGDFAETGDRETGCAHESGCGVGADFAKAIAMHSCDFDRVRGCGCGSGCGWDCDSDCGCQWCCDCEIEAKVCYRQAEISNHRCWSV